MQVAYSDEEDFKSN